MDVIEQADKYNTTTKRGYKTCSRGISSQHDKWVDVRKHNKIVRKTDITLKNNEVHSEFIHNEFTPLCYYCSGNGAYFMEDSYIEECYYCDGSGFKVERAEPAKYWKPTYTESMNWISRPKVSRNHKKRKLNVPLPPRNHYFGF